MRSISFASRRATATAVAVALIAGSLTIGGAIGLGLRLPGGWFGFGPDDNAELDYGALGRRVQRMDPGHMTTDAVVPEPDAAVGDARPPFRPRAVKPAPVVHSFTNDDFDDAYAVDELPFSARSDASGASRQTGEPTDCLPAGGTTWYRFDAGEPMALFGDTFGSRGATALGIYSGDSLAELTKVACDVNALGNAQVGFKATSGTYWFQVSRAIAEGPVFFELTSVGATTVETVSPSGDRPDMHAGVDHPEVSADGRWIVFISHARNLTTPPVDCGLPKCNTLYLRDRVTGTTEVIATAAAHEQLAMFGRPSLSPDGRFIGFFFLEAPGWPGFQGAPDAPEEGVNGYLYDRATGQFELVARNSAGEPGRGAPGRDSRTTQDFTPLTGSFAPSVSADGRYVAFASDAANLGGHVEAGRAWNVYRRDRVTGETRLVSVDAEGRPMRANSWVCTGRNLSGDGRYVFFSSTLGTGGESHDVLHLYLWDATTGRTRQVTQLPNGVQTLGSYCPTISLDGSRTAFVSRDALITEDTNGTPDVYTYDVATGRLHRASVTSAGEQTTDANYYSTENGEALIRAVTLSADGRYVAFDSSAPDLVPHWVGSTRRLDSGVPGPIQSYVHDVVTGATVVVSLSSTGELLAGNSVMPYVAPDGRSVSFMNSGLWSDANTVTQLDVMVHELR